MEFVMMCSITPPVTGMEAIAVRVHVWIQKKTAVRRPVTIATHTSTMATRALNWKATVGTVTAVRCALHAKMMSTTNTVKIQILRNMRYVTLRTRSISVICIVMYMECTILLNVTGTVATVASSRVHHLTMLQMIRLSRWLNSVTKLGMIVGIQHSRALVRGENGLTATSHANTHECLM